MSVQPSTNDTDASDELARFREEWKEEVRRKKAAAGAGSLQMQTQSVGPLDVTSFKPNNLDAIVQGHELPRAGTHSSQVNVKQILRATDTTSAPLGPMLQRAVELYRRAVVCEQQSNLDEALKLYRTAFRIDPNVDRAYHKIEAQFDVATNVSVAQQPAHATSSTKRSSIDGVTHSLKSLDVHSAVVPVAEGVAIPPGSLASIMAEWPALLEFLPEDEGKPVHIQKLPVEVLLLMLRKLGTTALERYALVCRKARFLTLDMGIWKEFVEATYKPPQISDDLDLDGLLTTYLGDYRRLYIEQPRVRLDGVYIAICHYTRSGVSDNAWMTPVHMVQYHRFLRFYPDGRVISLLSLEEPKVIIPALKPTLHAKGLSIGTWRLSGTTVHIESLIDPRAGVVNRHAFQMTLELRSRPLGRWNRLSFLSYESVNLDTGDVCPVPLKHDRGYHFSKVRSYS
ncbi:hypothetical protein C8Q72DRAFT_852664 [Fomitopsis betulina]|nr:hypothetical protein C8Q72DRAFT_852664 [Fomitopsis betulina]